jgi:hypothetical protein
MLVVGLVLPSCSAAPPNPELPVSVLLMTVSVPPKL